MNQAVREKGPGGLCAFLTDRRRACCLLAFALAVVCCFTSERAKLRDDPAAYLPEGSEALRGLAVMEAEFEDAATRRILVDNVAAPQAAELAERLSLAAGVRFVEFDEASDYQTGVARLTATFRNPEDSAETEKALAQLRFLLEGYDYAITGDGAGAALPDGELWLAVMAACTAALVLLAFFIRVPAVTGASVTLLTFGAAFLFNSGTWFLSGEISPAAAWGSALIQFAFCTVCVPPMFRQCVKARARMDTRDAVAEAWKRTAPAVLCGGATLALASLAMGLLRLRVGADPGLVTAKAVVLALLAICLLTPALLAELCEPLDRTLAREDAGGAARLADFAVDTRLLMPIAFAVVLIASNVGAGYFPRVYGAEALPIWFPWGGQKAEARTEELFGTDNELSILVPAGDANREAALLRELSAMDDVRTARGLANMETMGGYTLAERLTPRQFAELMDIELDAARQLYEAYASAENAHAHLSAGVDNAAIPLANMLLFACDRAREGYVTLDWGGDNALELLYRRTQNAVLRMQGANYSRLILNLSFPEGSPRSYASLYTLRNAVSRYYSEGVLLTGDAVRDADMSAVFRRDRVALFALTFAAALAALCLATASPGAAVIAAAVAQCGAWATFAVWLLAGQKLYFLTDLLIGAALTGLGVVFAGFVASRWIAYRKDADPKTALTQTLQDASRPVVTSGFAVALVSLGVGAAAPNRVLSSSAFCLAIGAAVSMALTLFVLPQMLLLLPAGKREPQSGADAPKAADVSAPSDAFDGSKTAAASAFDGGETAPEDAPDGESGDGGGAVNLSKDGEKEVSRNEE